MSHIPEDRLKMGAVNCTIRDNLILNRYYQKAILQGRHSGQQKLHDLSEDLQNFDVKTPDSDYKLGTLSGGNMQKVIFARVRWRQTRIC